MAKPKAQYLNSRDFSTLFHWVIDTGIWSRLKPSEMAVYIVLLRAANYTTKNCFLGRKTIADKSGVCLSSISETTTSLQSRGLIRKQSLAIDAVKFRTIYTLLNTPPISKPTENLGRGVTENSSSGVAENISTPPTENFGYINRDSRSRDIERETGLNRAENSDPFSRFECEYKTSIKKQAADVFNKVYKESWGDKSSFWLELLNNVADYHIGREQRGLLCSYASCVNAVVGKIPALARPEIKIHQAYFKKSLSELLEKETDIQSKLKEGRVRNYSSM